jgi:16S rRNA (guanine966-N2)-methyltransferase
MFNILAHNDFGIGFSLVGAHVADLFAGTGALGIEAISRGGAFCLFVDDSPDSRALVRQNVEALGLTGATKIWRRDATKLGPMAAGSGGPFDLVFLDPPYRKNLVPPSLAALRDGWLSERAIIVAEVGEDEKVETGDLRALDERVYGDTRVLFLAAAK